jgi:hypothetical protein
VSSRYGFAGSPVLVRDLAEQGIDASIQRVGACSNSESNEDHKLAYSVAVAPPSCLQNRFSRVTICRLP